MWARVAIYRGRPEQVQATMAKIQAEGGPALDRLQGFSGGFWAVDREHTSGLNMTLWENEEALKASAEATQTLRDAGSQVTGVEQLGVRPYEVLAWSTVDGAPAMQVRAARLGTFQGSFPGQLMDEHLRYLQEEFMGFLKLLPGYSGTFWLADRPAGDMLSFSVWASREDILRGGEQVKQRGQQRLAAGGKPGAESDRVELFDVWRSIWPALADGLIPIVDSTTAVS